MCGWLYFNNLKMKFDLTTMVTSVQIIKSEYSMLKIWYFGHFGPVDDNVKLIVNLS